jgi:PPOX class probable FMN-dependent enzyme
MNASPAWRDRLESALRGADEPEARYVQVATVRPDGRPANRTLVFRCFLDPGDRLVFTTDARSAKAAHLNTNPWAEACWYFASAREQFRVLGRGELLIEAENDTRARLWSGLSEPSRQSFTWPAPGACRAEAHTFDLPAAAAPPALVFALLVVHPDQVDHVDLKPHPHARTIYRSCGQAWSIEAVNP